MLQCLCGKSLKKNKNPTGKAAHRSSTLFSFCVCASVYCSPAVGLQSCGGGGGGERGGGCSQGRRCYRRACSAVYKASQGPVGADPAALRAVCGLQKGENLAQCLGFSAGRGNGRSGSEQPPPRTHSSISLPHHPECCCVGSPGELSGPCCCSWSLQLAGAPSRLGSVLRGTFGSTRQRCCWVPSKAFQAPTPTKAAGCYSWGGPPLSFPQLPPQPGPRLGRRGEEPRSRACAWKGTTPESPPVQEEHSRQGCACVRVHEGACALLRGRRVGRRPPLCLLGRLLHFHSSQASPGGNLQQYVT